MPIPPPGLRRILPWLAACSIVIVLIWCGDGLSAVLGQARDKTAGTAATETNDQTPEKSGVSRQPAARGIIDALREQVLQSPVFDEAGATDGLLNSLDEADTLFQDAKRRNRDAIRRLNSPQTRSMGSSSAPNVIVVAFERLGVARLSPDGPVSPLPRLREFANEGAVFSQAYAGSTDVDTSFWTLLSGMNTGRLPHGHSTVRDLGSEQFLPELLRRSGYVTACIGHWPMRPDPVSTGFDYWSGISNNNDQALLYPETMSLGGSVMRVPGNRGGAQGSTLWQLLQAETTSWLASRRVAAEPSCLIVRLPTLKPSDVNGAVQRETLEAWNDYLETLTKSLKSQQLDAKTCLIITALVPESTRADSSRLTTGLSERELRIPFVVSGSLLRQSGVQVERPVALWDVLPTCLELGSANRRPADRDGVSFLAGRTKATSSADRVLYWRASENPADQAVRKGRWKGVYSDKQQRIQLFDLENDPSESENVAASHPQVVKDLLFGSPDAVNATLKRLQD